MDGRAGVSPCSASGHNKDKRSTWVQRSAERGSEQFTGAVGVLAVSVSANEHLRRVWLRLLVWLQ